MKNWTRVLFLALLFLAFASVSFAEIKFTPGASFRLRHEYWKNIFDYNKAAKDNRNFFRFRYSFWGKTDFSDKASVYLRLTDEFKAYTYWYQPSGKKGYHFDINETVWDNFYLDLNQVADLPLDLRIGRQDFIGNYGEGFLIMDGTPLDGSRTYYFNAFKAVWKVNDKNSVDFIYINDPRTDEFLPIINEQKPPQALNITAEQAGVMYWKNSSIDKLALEPYFIYKTEGEDGGTRLQSKKGTIYTPAVYAKYDLTPVTLRGQVAEQSGNYGSNDREALGGYLFVDRDFKGKFWNPKLSAGYIYLSGDDPSSAKNEGWDPLFSRYPWFSELYSLSYNSESGMDYWTNLQAWRVGAAVNPSQKLKLEAFYNFLRANEIPSGTAFTVGGGKNRGHLPQVRATYTFNKNVSTYFLAEYLIPGNFYASDADPALFLRTELMMKF